MYRTTENLTIDKALAKFGVTPETLTATQRDELDTRGYTIFQNVIDTPWLDELREAFELIYDEEGDLAGIEVAQLPGCSQAGGSGQQINGLRRCLAESSGPGRGPAHDRPPVQAAFSSTATIRCRETALRTSTSTL